MMKKNLLILLSIIFCTTIFAQNPTITLSSNQNVICSTGNDSIVVSINATGIFPNSDIVLYASSDSTFNPYNNQGDSIGFVHIGNDGTGGGLILNTSCPTILGIFIDACNNNGLSEPANEYILINSGSGFAVNDLGVDLPNGATNGSNADINYNGSACQFTTVSTTLMDSLRVGFCNATNLIAANPGTTVPANALVIIFSGAGEKYPYNFSSLCELGVPIYILQSGCERSSGAFVNNDANGTTCDPSASSKYRTTGVYYNGCENELTYTRCGLPIYDSNNPNEGDGNYVIRLDVDTDTSSFANGGMSNNAADRCNGVNFDSLANNLSFTYHIPTSFCNLGKQYIKAIAKPSSGYAVPPLSNSIAFNLICNDVSANTDNSIICSGENAAINISSTNPNATLSWTVSGGTNISGASAGTGTTINQTLTNNGTVTDSIIYTITATDNGCTKNTTIKIYVEKCTACIPNFIAPDTVCLGDLVTIQNLTNCGTTYDWQFCKQDIIQGVTGLNLGSLPNMPNRPTSIRVFKEDSNWIGFLGNDASPSLSYSLRRLNFGNNLLNIPTIETLPDFPQIEVPRGHQFIKENNNWYAIVTSGYNSNNNLGQSVAILSFGNSLSNTPMLYNDLGNLSNLISSSEIMERVEIVESDEGLFAFVNSRTTSNGKITKIDFGSSITNINPTYETILESDLLVTSRNIKFFNSNGNWYGLTTNDGYPNNPIDDKLIRLNFGNSINNVPTVDNLGNPGNNMNRTFDLLLYNDCEGYKILGQNYATQGLISFTFPNGYLEDEVNSYIVASSQSYLPSPNSFSQVLIENGQKYAFVTNTNNNSISRIRIEPECIPVGIPTSTQYNPPTFTADSLGVITVTLTVDKNLATEAVTCQQIVVVDTVKQPLIVGNTSVCTGDSIVLSVSNVQDNVTYTWTGPNGFTATDTTIKILNATNTNAGQYTVTATGYCGSKTNNITLQYCNECIPSFIAPDMVCLGDLVTIQNLTNCGTTYDWQFCKQDIIQGVTGLNLGSLTNMPSRPHRIQIFKEGNNWIGFMGNDAALPGSPLRQLNFGNSLLNTPTITSLPDFAQTKIPRSFQLYNENGDWYAIVLSGYNSNNASYQSSAILKFGTSLTNTPTLYRDLGNLGGVITSSETMVYVELAKSNDSVFAFYITTNATTGYLTQLSFGNSITNTPNVSRIITSNTTWTKPTAIKIIKQEEKYYGFSSDNATGNDKLFRLDFGTSLSNIPILNNLGNPNGQMNRVYDMLLYNDCEGVKLLGSNVGNHELISFLFPDGLTSNNVEAYSLGNIGNLSQPTGFSQILVENGQKYVFVTNGMSNSISRLNIEPECIPVGIPPSTQYNPLTFTADSLGIITVTLTVDKNLPTEAVTCQQIVVVDTVQKPIATANQISCNASDTLKLMITNTQENIVYTWSGPNGFSATGDTVNIPNATANNAGQYIVTATGYCGSKLDTVLVEVNNLPTVFIGNDTTICAGSSVILNATTANATYTWSTSATSATITVNQAGTYWVDVTVNGCSARDSIVIGVVNPPTKPNLGNDTAYCGSFSRTLSTGDATTTWNTGATGASITVTQGGTYIATITTNCGVVKDTIVITQNTIPTINLGIDRNICSGTSTTLDATTTNATYTWSTGASSASITVNQAGTYWVDVTVNGCSARDSIVIGVVNPPTKPNLGNDTAYCGSFSRTLSTGDATTTWNTGATGASITVSQGGEYIATIDNGCGVTSDTVIITQYELPSVSLGNDTALCGDLLLSIPSGFTTILWSTGSTDTSIIINKTGLYSVTVTNQNDCEATNEINFTSTCVDDIFIPNSFTPNGDGVNDIFMVRSNNDNIIVEKMLIYNRWGELVYEANEVSVNDMNGGWNGDYKKEAVQAEVYAYYILLRFEDGNTKKYKGNITLFK